MAVLTEKDKQEGKDLMEQIESLPEKEKMQVSIYVGALHDRQMIVDKKSSKFVNNTMPDGKGE